MTALRFSGLHWLLGAPVAAALALIAIARPTPGLMEAWLLVFVVLAGLAVGALGALMVGHLLGEIWLDPVRDELEPMARSMPLVAILGVPLLFALDDLYPWVGNPSGPRGYFDASGFTTRSIIYFVVWIALTAWIARPGRHRAISAAGLTLLVPTVGLASIDWIASREANWISSLYGFSFVVAQGFAALGLAMMITLLRQGHPPAARLRSLQVVMAYLAFLILWVWFSQFLIVWMADLPEESAWYLVRQGGVPAILQSFIALPALCAVFVLMIPPRPRRVRAVAGAALALVQHVAHMVWLVRPRAAESMTASDLAIATGPLAVWALFVWMEISRQPPLVRECEADVAT
ncbi:MAG: hypothetical protein M3Y78_13800 [Pseudomonadota bacterium]|nr:hypothetical protein [Pseudomonadota bacterium]